MELKALTMSLLLLFLSFLLYVYFFSRGKKYSNKLPPGSLGLPLIGQSFTFQKAMKDDKIKEWFQKGIVKHGPLWKSRLFGSPVVVLHGTTANKFVYTCAGGKLANTQPPSVSRILGGKSIVKLTGDNHKRIREALFSFLKPDVLKQFVAKIDEETQNHLETHWHGRNEVQVQPLLKTLTFNVICSLVFGIKRGPKRDQFLPPFKDMIRSFISIPVNLPFTQFNRGLKARKKVITLLVDLLHEKREALKEQKQQPTAHKDQDLITALLKTQYGDSSGMMLDEEIIDNIIVLMLGGYDTISVLLTLIVKCLANNKPVYLNIAREQEEIMKSKSPGEALIWEDLTKMKYTSRVVSETLRIHPPVNFHFQRATQDIEYEGYTIPKGWQVMVSASMTHMDDNIFPNPAMFDPTRFEKHAPSPPPFSLLSFGAGPRMCPGMEFAKMETLVMIHRLVTSFTWELLNKDESFKRNPFPEFDQGLQAQISPIIRECFV